MSTESARLLASLRAIAHRAANERRGLDPAETRDWLDTETAYLAASGLRMADDPDPLKRLTAYAEEERYHAALMRYVRLGKDAGVNPDFSADNRLFQARAQGSDDPTAGGFLLSGQLHASVVEGRDAVGGIASAALSLDTPDGREHRFSRVDDSAESGRIVRENDQLTEGADADFGSVVLRAWTFSSRVIKVPIQLLQDEAVDLESHIGGRLGRRLARAEAPYFAGGDPLADEPSGLLSSGLAVGVTAAGTATVTRTELVELAASVDRAHRAGGTFVMGGALEADLLAREASGVAVFPEMAAGRLIAWPYVVDDGMGALATGETPAAFGNIKEFWIRRVPGRLVRMTQSFADSGQVGFVATERVDSALVGAGSPVKTLVLS